MLRWLFLFLFPLALNASDETGVVSIYFPSGAEHAVKLYQSVNDTAAVHTCFTDDALDSVLPSYYRYGGRVFITYRCIGESNNRYHIRNDDVPAVTYWITKDSLTEYRTWKAWFTGFGQITTGEPFRFYAKQGDHFPIKQTCSCGVYSVGEISGDWMKISYDDAYSDFFTCECPAEIKTQSLWIKWRQGNKIFVSVYIAE